MSQIYVNEIRNASYARLISFNVIHIKSCHFCQMILSFFVFSILMMFCQIKNHQKISPALAKLHWKNLPQLHEKLTPSV